MAINAVSGCVYGALLIDVLAHAKKAFLSPEAEDKLTSRPTASAVPVYEEVSPKEELN